MDTAHDDHSEGSVEGESVDVPLTTMTNPYTTAYHPAEVGLSDENLPDVLFQLEPPADWGREVVPFVRNDDEEDVKDGDGRRYRAFEFLPLQISANPEAWRLLLYTDRSHPHCGARDLQARMWPMAGQNVLQANAINMRKTRLRNALSLPCWVRRTKKPTMLDCLLHEQYSWNSVLHNSALPVGNGGFVKPVMPGSDTPATPVLIHLRTFTGAQFPHMPSEWLEKVFDTIADLQDKAFIKGYAHWIFLKNGDKPAFWSFKAESQHHPRTGPLEIRVPRVETMPSTARIWIEECVRDASRSGPFVPTLASLPEHTRRWIRSIPESTNSTDPSEGEVESHSSEEQGRTSIVESEDEQSLMDDARQTYTEHHQPVRRPADSHEQEYDLTPSETMGSQGLGVNLDLPQDQDDTRVLEESSESDSTSDIDSNGLVVMAEEKDGLEKELDYLSRQQGLNSSGAHGQIF